MNAATTAELARLGVPFFAIDSALIAKDTDEGPERGKWGEREAGTRREKKGRREMDEEDIWKRNPLNRTDTDHKEQEKNKKGSEEGGKMITKTELENLKRKMLVLLEDLCGGE